MSCDEAMMSDEWEWVMMSENEVMMSDADRSAEANSEASADASAGSGELVIRTPQQSIKPRGGNQLSYCRAIRKNDINFGIGPAGTGKTYLAVACAVEALMHSRRVLGVYIHEPTHQPVI